MTTIINDREAVVAAVGNMFEKRIIRCAVQNGFHILPHNMLHQDIAGIFQSVTDRHPQRTTKMMYDIMHALQSTHWRSLLQKSQDRHLTGTHQAVPYSEWPDQFKHHHGAKHNRFKEFAANRPIMSQLTGKADSDTSLGHQSQADIRLFVRAKSAKAGTNSRSQPLAKS